MAKHGRVFIFDTTLRDGEQSPGASMSPDEKLLLAGALADLNVDVIEAGFPISSPAGFNAFREIAQVVGSRSSICALARCLHKDIDCAGEALLNTERPRIHVFCATSPIHREMKLRLTRDEILEITSDCVKRAVKIVGERGEVEFSPEDASRTESAFLAEVVLAAIEAGAKVINLPDTVGHALPAEYGKMFADLRRAVPEIDARGTILSAHCHNDLGMAVGNTVEAIRNGARQVECTINGIGERAGNAQLEAIVMAIRTRGEQLGTNLHTEINTQRLNGVSNVLRRVTGLVLARHTPIVGRNAFAHEAGIHQHGMEQDRRTYEIMYPEDVGRSASKFVLGRHSGQAGVERRLRDLGISLTETQLGTLMIKFKSLADQRSEVHDDDLYALINAMNVTTVPNMVRWELVDYKIERDSEGVWRGVAVLLNPEGQRVSRHGTGNGPFNALSSAIRELIGLPDLKLSDWLVRGTGYGEDGLAAADIGISYGEKEFHGHGADTDSLKAPLCAYLQAINNALRDRSATAAA